MIERLLQSENPDTILAALGLEAYSQAMNITQLEKEVTPWARATES